MPTDYYDIEERIRKALASIPEDETPNISSLARQFGVPQSRLRARYKGRGSRSTREPTNTRLNKRQEAALCDYIDRFEKNLGIFPRRDVIMNAANSILRGAKSVAPPPLGDKWLKRFFERHEEYRIRHKRARAIERRERN